ncbi:MAG: DNA translocase FtsK [Lachnospiraceae bacterium]|nr:DNA translocase FtsK [Lachnospiraceae bacterium]
MTDLRLRDFPANGQGTGKGSRPSRVRNRVQKVDPSAWNTEFSPDPEVTSTDEYDLRGRYPDRQDSGSVSGGGRTSRVRAPRDRRPIDQIGVDNLLSDDVPVYNASGIDDFIVYDGLSRRNGSGSRPAYGSSPDLYDEADPYDEPACDDDSAHWQEPARRPEPAGQQNPVRQVEPQIQQDPVRHQDSARQPDPYYDLDDDDDDDGGTYDPYENVDYRRDLRSDGVSADGIVPDDYGMEQPASSGKADRGFSGNSSRLGNDSQSIWRDPSDTASRGNSGSVTFRASGSGSAAVMGAAGMGAGQGAGKAGAGSDGGRQDPARQGKASPRPAQKKKKTKYKFPSTELLKRNNASYGGDIMSQREMQEELRRTLENFGVSVTMGDIAAGPTVTRFELIPDPGVKVSRITNLQDDIKLALASADVRIEAPIPGKRAVGIEVPNSASAIVGFRELVESREFRRSPSNLSVCVGRNLDGEIEIADLAKMPHLLIAGATGSGKSVCINTFIMSILYKADPEDVKLIMIDPKVVELSVYNGIPHLLIPVVTDARKAANALHWAVEEMDARYRKFAKWNARNLTGYNEALARKKKEDPSLEEEPMSQMVIIIDELADLMMVSPSEVEESICRLAQKARAAGIHMVLATQRPSVNVITGLIKANVPSRIAFAVSSGVDSRTIIDMNGAEKLLGKGDMLYYPYGFQKPIRVQGAFISDDEVSRVVDQIIEDNGEPSGEEMMEQLITSASDSSASRSVDRDEYFEEAGRFIIENDKATSGSLQRQFHIGFNRAARIMDQLAEAGVVGEEQGTKPRQIMMNMEQFEAMLKS